MHHSDRLNERMKEEARRLELGATGDYPAGKLNEEDEGGLRLGVTVAEGKVVISFGKPVAWLGMDPQQARQLAELIRKNSHRAEGK